jgi:hypothetical protein
MNLAKRILLTLEERALWPPDTFPRIDRGIIMTGAGRQMVQILANLATIRAVGYEGPIDFWHLPGEFNERQLAKLSKDVNVIKSGDSPYNGMSGTRGVYGFKAWMLSQSRFSRSLLLDVNSFPLRSLDCVFDSRQTCVLWQNGPFKGYYKQICDLRAQLHLPLYSHEFESGQIFADQGLQEVRFGIHLAAAINAIGLELADYVNGDKETYSIAFDLIKASYTIAPPATVCPVDSQYSCPGLLQPWLNCQPLFFHPMHAKEVWWKFKAEWHQLHCECEDIAKSLA